VTLLYNLTEIVFIVVGNPSLVNQVLKVPYITLVLVLSFQIKFAHFAVSVVEAWDIHNFGTLYA